MNKYIAYSKDNFYRLEIEEDVSVGFYLIIYPKGEKQSVADYLQDTLEFAMEEAEELYGVTKNDWKKSKS